MNDHLRINQTSGKVEFYTPSNIVMAARLTMNGRIDLDPASSPAANARVKAAKIFTEADDGLRQRWGGNVWMNHPFGKSEKACPANCSKPQCRKRGFHLKRDIAGNREWIQKIETEFSKGHVEEACCITFAATSEGWFRPLLLRPQCFLSPRTNYLLPDGTKMRGVTKGSVVTFFCRDGESLAAFAKHFDKLGVVKIPFHLVNK